MTTLHFPDPSVENPWTSPTGKIYIHDGVKWVSSGGDTPSEGGLQTWTPSVTSNALLLAQQVFEQGGTTNVTPFSGGVSLSVSGGQSISAVSTDKLNLFLESEQGIYLTTEDLRQDRCSLRFSVYNDPIEPDQGFTFFEVVFQEADETYGVIGTDEVLNQVPLGSLPTVTDSTVICANIKLDVVGSDDVLTLKLLYGGNSSSAETVFTYQLNLSLLAENVGVNIKDSDWYFSLDASSNDVSEITTEVKQYSTPPFTYEGIPVALSLDQAIDPNSYPDDRADQAFQIIGDISEAFPVDSVLGKAFAGLIWTFDENGVPLYSTGQTKPEVNLVDPIDFTNDLTVSGQFNDFIPIETNSFGGDELSYLPYRKHLIKIRNNSTTTPTTVNIALSDPDQEKLPWVTFAAIGKRGSIKFVNSGGKNFWINGESTDSTEYLLTTGGYVTFVSGPSSENENYTHIIEMAGDTGSAPDFALDWVAGESGTVNVVSGGKYYNVNRGNSLTYEFPDRIRDDFKPVTVALSDASSQVTFRSIATAPDYGFIINGASAVVSFSYDKPALLTFTTKGNGFDNLIEVTGIPEEVETVTPIQFPAYSDLEEKQPRQSFSGYRDITAVGIDTIAVLESLGRNDIVMYKRDRDSGSVEWTELGRIADTISNVLTDGEITYLGSSPVTGYPLVLITFDNSNRLYTYSYNTDSNTWTEDNETTIPPQNIPRSACSLGDGKVVISTDRDNGGNFRGGILTYQYDLTNGGAPTLTRNGSIVNVGVVKSWARLSSTEILGLGVERTGGTASSPTGPTKFVYIKEGEFSWNVISELEVSDNELFPTFSKFGQLNSREGIILFGADGERLSPNVIRLNNENELERVILQNTYPANRTTLACLTGTEIVCQQSGLGLLTTRLNFSPII